MHLLQRRPTSSSSNRGDPSTSAGPSSPNSSVLTPRVTSAEPLSVPSSAKASPLSSSLSQLETRRYSTDIDESDLSRIGSGAVTEEEEHDEETIDGLGYMTASPDASPRSSRIQLDDPSTPSPNKRNQQRSQTQGISSDAHLKRVSPLAKRLGEQPPFMLPHPSHSKSTSNAYPGVVIGAFAGSGPGTTLGFGVDDMKFDGNMEDIMDPAARAGERQDRGSGQAGANIAPWLMDDSGPSNSHPKSQPQPDPPAPVVKETKQSSKKSGLNHFSSVPHLTKIRRATESDHGSNRNVSHPNVPPLPTSSSSSSHNLSSMSGQSRNASNDSVQTVAVNGRGHSAVPESVRHMSIAPAPRGSRFGSTASYASSGQGSVASDKKKGFLGGLLKRRTGANSSNPMPGDFHPSDGSHRGSASGSNSSRLTMTSQSSLGSRLKDRSGAENPYSDYIAEDLVSPMHEHREPELLLDMDLDNMDGIVDPNIANVPAAQPVPPTRGATGLSNSTVDSSSSLGLADALTFSSMTTSVSGDSSVSSGSVAPGRTVIAETQRGSGPFAKDPFSSPQSPGEKRATTPTSPMSMSPKHVLPSVLNNQPRRPSQLRNVKMGSADSEESEGTPDGHSLAPPWLGVVASNQSTVFNTDPFGTKQLSTQSVGEVSPSNPVMRLTAGTPVASHDHVFPTQPDVQDTPRESSDAGLAPPGGAAWAAPESWGVEGDEEVPETSESSEEGGDESWTEEAQIERIEREDSADASPISGKPPPFGYKSINGVGVNGSTAGSSRSGRPGTGQAKTRRGKDGRPSTSHRPGTGSGRPGTSGSAHVANVPYYTRIYRADESYDVIAVPFSTTVAEIINMLSGADEPGTAGARKTTSGMRIYLRERGQERALLAHERPLAIQTRRLQQAGHSEDEPLDIIGKNDLGILVRFIYQTPVLPVMDPEEESSYDSFEFIDIAGRDLQVIPIFLHLHAHNIIILNLSRNPLADLPLDFIQACTSLKELRLSNMALKKVPGSIKHSTTLTRLDISCNRINDLEHVQLNDIPTLSSLKVQNNKLTSIPSYFAQMKALKYLKISNNKFSTFPAVVCEMSNLVDLDVSFNEITELPSEMSNLKSLERFSCNGNDLTTFPESFSTLANLRILDVRRNKLIDLNAVYSLPNLTTLRADNNNLVTLDARLGAKVREFSVPHNSITRFTLAPLPDMAAAYSLTHLNLSHGKISTLADEALSELVNLVELNLNFNQFTRLPDSIGRLVNLEVFSCTDNMLNSLPLGFGGMQRLRIMNIHNNNLKRLTEDLWNCSSLEVFNASSNLIDGFSDPPPLPEDSAGFVDHRKMSLASNASTSIDTERDRSSYKGPAAGWSLQKVYIGDNKITDEIFHQLAHLCNLKVLNLSFNEIHEIPPDTICHNENLEQLYLSGNKLTSLPSEDLERLSKLKVLHLNGNKLQTLPSELGAIKTLQHLDVGSNVLKYNIANWPYDWNWNWNTGLRYLNLSGNKRLEIKPTSGQDMSHASTFRKELSDFSALTQLRVLGLMDVTLRIPSLPDESDEKRVRTSFSDINNMAYGISDMLGSIEHLAMFDMVVPNFRGKENECLFGMFGRAAPSVPSGKIPKYLQEVFADILAGQLERLRPDLPTKEALRRAFVFSSKETANFLYTAAQRRKGSTVSAHTTGRHSWVTSHSSQMRTGASGAVVYLVGKTMHVANVGDSLVVLSRKGEAELLSKRHDPTDREETARIRAAEAWVSTAGYINDEKEIDISRAFGYYHALPAVNADPEVRTRELADSDEFVIIGNSALWNCCSYQTAVDIARTERSDPMMAAQKLRDFAISYGADGSVMVMVLNISDLFFGRGARGRSTANVETNDGDFYTAGKRTARRRAEEVGDRTLNRLQQEVEPPTGTVALVFTDIKNSTALWETNPGMATAIKMHHNLMRRQLRLDGGYEVKTEGDSFMVSFPSVTAGLLWCFHCQILLLQQEWPRELLECEDGKEVLDAEGNIIQRGLSVRMGIHWGVPSCERDPITRRMDYYGPMVNRAARINASADGGQLMASLDVINELSALREYVESKEGTEDGEVNPELKKELNELTRIGVEVKAMGERKLKGLEVPEKLHLIYPQSLAGRLEVSDSLRANVEVNAAKTFSTERIIDIDEVRQLSMLTLRLEALCSPPPLAMLSPKLPSSPGLGLISPRKMAAPVTSSLSTTGIRSNLPPVHLGPTIKEDMSDEELGVIIESLTTRIENSMSTLYIKNLGGFASVLAALEQATRIDPKLLLHAMSLMNGAMR